MYGQSKLRINDNFTPSQMLCFNCSANLFCLSFQYHEKITLVKPVFPNYSPPFPLSPHSAPPTPDSSFLMLFFFLPLHHFSTSPIVSPKFLWEGTLPPTGYTTEVISVMLPLLSAQPNDNKPTLKLVKLVPGHQWEQQNTGINNCKFSVTAISYMILPKMFVLI